MAKRVVGGLVMLFFLVVALVNLSDYRRQSRQAFELTIQTQKAQLLDLQQKVGGGGLLELQLMIPLEGVGIEYGAVARSRDGGGFLIAVEVLEVYRDSSAGRAGVLPGDLISIIGENGLCNLLLTKEDSIERQLQGHRNLGSMAEKFFALAPDSFTLTVLRDGRELQFKLVRGEVAPELRDYIHKNLSAFEKHIAISKPLIDKLVADCAKVAEDDRELTKRERDIWRVRQVFDLPWREVEELRRLSLVPRPTEK